MREKLIELIEKAYYCSIEELADHLIANGVTVQEWIPVTERLPEANKRVLGTKRGADAAFVFYGKWHNGNWYDLEWNCYRYGVTHWMPLPETPKGE